MLFRSADTLAHLTLDDVQPRKNATLPKQGRLTARLETFDGLRVTMTMVEQDGRHEATVSAEFDHTLVQPPPSEVEEKGEPEREGTEAEPVASGETAVKLKDPEAVRQEAQAFNEQRGGWVYVLPGFRAETLATRTGALIKK